MSRVAFVVDIEHGHILATYEFAERAQRFGHQVSYLAAPDRVEMIRREGFDVVEVLSDALPRGATHELVQQAGGDPDRMLELAVERVLPALANGRGLGSALAHVRPDLLFMSSLFQLEAFTVRLRHRLPMALLTSQLRLQTRADACRVDLSRLFDMGAGTQEIIALIQTALPGVRTVDQLAEVVLSMPELIVLPRAFEMPDARPDAMMRFVGTCVRREADAPMDWQDIDGSRPLIYCSLGSQSPHRWPIRQRFFETVVAAASRRPSLQWLLAIGSHAAARLDVPIPPNVTIRPWVPQLAVLRRASLMLTHAGVGTVKECLVAGVPMGAFPLARDQFVSAQHLQRHGLGFVGDVESVTAAWLVEAVDGALRDQALRERVEALRDRVLAEDAACEGVDDIAEVLRLTAPLGLASV
jgi:MGT family glycosyltransferase